MATILVSSDSLQTPLSITLSPNEKDLEDKAIAEIVSVLEKSKRPVIVIDGRKFMNHS
jgi:TPP-dependent 2-oxoacid decarboxylase